MDLSQVCYQEHDINKKNKKKICNNKCLIQRLKMLKVSMNTSLT